MIDDITKRADRVRAEHDALVGAKADKHAAQVALLRAVVDAVKPALPALCSKIQNVPGPITRALNVAHNLYLGEGGGWVESREGGAMLIRRTDGDIARDYVAEDIVEAISQALTKQIGARDWATSEIRVEAERLRAAVLLLSSVPISQRSR